MVKTELLNNITVSLEIKYINTIYHYKTGDHLNFYNFQI